jgi:hypothetical protein
LSFRPYFSPYAFSGTLRVNIFKNKSRVNVRNTYLIGFWGLENGAWLTIWHW